MTKLDELMSYLLSDEMIQIRGLSAYKKLVAKGKELQQNQTVVTNGYLAENVDGEDIIIEANNIADAFDKLDDISPNHDEILISCKSYEIHKC